MMSCEPPEMKRFGVLLRAWRREKGVAQGALEEAAGLGANAIGRYERGENSPTLETFDRLCRALGVSPSQFFDGPPGFQSSDNGIECPGSGGEPPPGHHAVSFTLDTYGHAVPGQAEALGAEELLGKAN